MSLEEEMSNPNNEEIIRILHQRLQTAKEENETLTQQNKQMRKALEETTELIKSMVEESDKRKNITAPEDIEILELCKKYYFGATLDSVARLYRKHVEELFGAPESSAITTGHCICVLKSVLKRAQQALKGVK